MYVSRHPHISSSHLPTISQQQRELKLSQIHAQAASRAASLDVGRPGEHPEAIEPGLARAEVGGNGNAAGAAAGAAPGMGPTGATA